MNVVKSCEPIDKPAYPSTSVEDIPVGMVFRYGNHKFGPYLKLPLGLIIDIGSNNNISGLIAKVVDNYKPLPNAKLVTEEIE